jgi:hypothetical protein
LLTWIISGITMRVWIVRFDTAGPARDDVEQLVRSVRRRL